MSLLQLNPPLPVQTTDGRKGFAHVLADAGQESESLLFVALDTSRELWWFRNRDLRIQDNLTLGRIPYCRPDANRS